MFRYFHVVSLVQIAKFTIKLWLASPVLLQISIILKTCFIFLRSKTGFLLAGVVDENFKLSAKYSEIIKKTPYTESF